MAEPFRAQVAVTGWYDADTCYGVLDSGYGRYWGKSIRVVPTGYVTDRPTVIVEPQRLRAALIDAPENTEIDGSGLRAAEFARSLVPLGVHRCDTYKLDNFGRPMVDIVTTQGLFSQVMLDAGHAWVYRGLLPQDD